MADVETLRRAAALMRERAEKARAGKWFASGVEVATEWNVEPRSVALAYGSVVPEGNIANAEHIASWHPAVALAVAELLDHEAEACGLNRSPFLDETHRLAHTLARAYLGGE